MILNCCADSELLNNMVSLFGKSLKRDVTRRLLVCFYSPFAIRKSSFRLFCDRLYHQVTIKYENGNVAVMFIIILWS